MARFVHIFIFLTLLIIGCSTTEESIKRDNDNYTEVRKFRNEVNLTLDKNVSWINRMPGTSPKFHVSGKLSVLESDSYDSEKLELKNIRILQGDREIYFIIPKVVERTEQNQRSITYSTIKGLSLNDKMNSDNPITIELIFQQDYNEFKYRINGVKIEEVL